MSSLLLHLLLLHWLRCLGGPLHLREHVVEGLHLLNQGTVLSASALQVMLEAAHGLQLTLEYLEKKVFFPTVKKNKKMFLYLEQVFELVRLCRQTPREPLALRYPLLLLREEALQALTLAAKAADLQVTVRLREDFF